MSVDKIWVLAEVADGAPITTSLELITRARSLAGTVEAVAWGDATASVAATLGEYGVTTVHDVGDLGGALPGVPVAAAIAAAVAAGAGPDAVLFPATYDGRDIAGRLSAKLDRPVLTNVVDLIADDGGLVTQHAIFGGTQVVSARFTGEGPGIYVVRAKSFPAEPSGGAPATVAAAPAADLGARALCLAGGVAANSLLRRRVQAACAEDGIGAFLPSRALCTDNAAMVAAAGWWRLNHADPSPLTLGADPNLRLVLQA